MTEEYVIALDQGTTSTRADVYDRNFNRVAGGRVPLNAAFPQPGWVEQDPEELFASAVETLSCAVKAVGAEKVAAIGITNQRETAVVWDRSGKAIGPAIVWQCRRTAERMEELRAQGYADYVRDKTGLRLDAYFSASKFERIIADAGAGERLRRGELYLGTVDSWLVYRLTGGRVHATDYTNASRTMLFDIHARKWDDGLVSLFGLNGARLPEVRPSGGRYGFTDPGVVGGRIAICAVAGDQQAALYGHGCTQKGSLKNTYGTGIFLLMNTGKEAAVSRAGLITTIAAGLNDSPDYVLEGSSFVGGAAVQWLRDGAGMIESAAESETVARSVSDSGGVYFVPAFVGLGAPWWDSDARGLITGITRGTRREHIVRATLEAIAYTSADLVRAMERDAGLKINEMNADGGAAANGLLMQFQADILGADVIVPRYVETTSLGAALLAGRAAGFCGGEKRSAPCTRFFPAMTEADRTRLYSGWLKAIARSRA